MHELLFAEAAIPSPVECLNVPLAPYSVRHELILLRHRSPLLCLSETEFNALTTVEQVFAIALAVQTCAAKRIWWPWLWRKGLRRDDYPLAIAEFRNYIAAARTLLPALNSKKKDDFDAYEIANNGEKMTGGRSLGSPLLAQLINFGIIQLRLTYEETLDSPLAHIANLYFAHLESTGCVNIENADEADARRQMTEHRQQVGNETAAARAAWETATTEEARAAAYAAHPRIGNLFADAWNATTTPDERRAVADAWGLVARAELAKSEIDFDTLMQIEPKETPCPA